MIYTRNLTQDCTYFSTVGYDAYGQPIPAKGKLLKCRWQASNSLFKDATGREFVAEAVVYCSQEVGLGGKLKLGKARKVDDAKEIKALQISFSLDGKQKIIKAVV